MARFNVAPDPVLGETVYSADVTLTPPTKGPLGRADVTGTVKYVFAFN